jgi:TM2 domain-containing membrane protein YozV
MSVQIIDLIPVYGKILNKPKNRNIALILAFLGTVTPLAGLHKFYLGQPLWGTVYFVLLWFAPPLPHIACAIEAVWYLALDREQFERRFNLNYKDNFSLKSISPGTGEIIQVKAIADGLRELDRLREDGLISEYEFEQKRRQLLNHI